MGVNRMTHQLLVMRLENMIHKHPKQDNSYFCMTCFKQVGIYPSGQRAILENPEIEIICEICAAKEEPYDKIQPAPGAIEEVLKNRRRRK
jgi:hypothetical protein